MVLKNLNGFLTMDDLAIAMVIRELMVAQADYPDIQNNSPPSQLNTVSPYHPSSNGLAERAMQTFKQGLKKMKYGTLQTKISRFLFSYRTTPQSTTGVSPAELLMGRKYCALHLIC